MNHKIGIWGSIFLEYSVIPPMILMALNPAFSTIEQALLEVTPLTHEM